MLGRIGTKVIFSYPNKLSQIPVRVSKGKKKCLSTETKTVDCQRAVVYSIPCSCNKRYIGQTQGCVNTRLTQHEGLYRRELKVDLKQRAEVKGDLVDDEDLVRNKRLVEHLFKDKNCYAKYEETKVLYKHPSKLLREVVEAYYIERGGEEVISEASTLITREERRLLQRRL